MLVVSRFGSGGITHLLGAVRSVSNRRSDSADIGWVEINGGSGASGPEQGVRIAEAEVDPLSQTHLLIAADADRHGTGYAVQVIGRQIDGRGRGSVPENRVIETAGVFLTGSSLARRHDRLDPVRRRMAEFFGLHNAWTELYCHLIHSGFFVSENFFLGTAMSFRHFCLGLTVFTIAVPVHRAKGDTTYQAINLYPGAGSTVVMTGAAGGKQVGWILSNFHALMWSGSAASLVDLTPSVTTSAVFYGTDGPHQVGYILRASKNTP
jgi:hypothetical protein